MKKAQDYRHIRNPELFDEGHYNGCGCITSMGKDIITGFGHCDTHRASYPMGQGISRKEYLKIPMCSVCHSVHRDHERHVAKGFLTRALDTIKDTADLTQLEAFYDELIWLQHKTKEMINDRNRANLKRQKEADKP